MQVLRRYVFKLPINGYRDCCLTYVCVVLFVQKVRQPASPLREATASPFAKPSPRPRTRGVVRSYTVCATDSPTNGTKDSPEAKPKKVQKSNQICFRLT